MSAAPSTQRPPVAAAALPRLLATVAPGERATTLDEHLGHYGTGRAVAPHELAAALEASGLRGRGGAGFPTATKLRSVAAQGGRPVVLVNGAEGEPLSGKDKVLLGYLPHLVLDGAVAAATALAAREVVVATSRKARAEGASVAAAIRERAAARLDGRVELRHEVVPDGFVVGEETALINVLNGGPPKPTFTPPLPFERGLHGAPTLVQNAETLANVGLIARYGPEWFSHLGTRSEPGTILVTLSGAVAVPGVYEVALGSTLRELVAKAGGTSEEVSAFLVGGYFGTWIAAAKGADLRLLDAELRHVGAALGARAVVAFPRSACGVAESARITRYLAGESAGQCGPCVHGLAAIADAFEGLASGTAQRRSDLNRWVEVVRGRGACRHPDGASQFAASAVNVFAAEVEQHVRHGRCTGSGVPVLPTGRSK